MPIRPATASDIPGLAAVLVAAVADNASIGFMAGLDAQSASAFWQDRLAAVARGDLHILVAVADGTLAGTVTLNLATPPNQPHRADVQKMIVAPTAQRRGIGAALLAAIEALAHANDRTTLVLDTISNSAAARLYERAGWSRIGEIPAYALMPDGTMAPTTIYARHSAS